VGAHARTAADPATPEVLRDLLALVGYEASVEAISGWSLERRVEAEVYAVNVHLRASDNEPLRAYPRPAWLPAPWLGPDAIEGGIFGPGGTPL
jgi:hypothetical protein